MKKFLIVVSCIVFSSRLIGQVAPIAVNDQFFNLRSTTIYNLLNNSFTEPDKDLAGLPLSIVIEETDKKSVNGATIKVVSASTIEFTPNQSFAGWDTFNYVIVNTASLKDTAKVVVFMISGIRTDSVVFSEGNIVNVNILLNDAITNRSSVSLKNVPALKYGEAIYDKGIVKYTAKGDVLGEEEFYYTVCDTFDNSQPPICKDGKISITRLEITLKIPAGLSPNGDMINDNLNIPLMENFPNSSMKIYNRYGDEVWKSFYGYKNDFIGKNSKGEDLPDGTYYYILELNKTGYFKKYASSLSIQR